MQNKPKKVLISVGEASGDLHASNLIKATSKITPDIKFYGMGSDLMEKAGADLIVNSKALSVFGGLEIITNLFKIWRAFNVMKKALSNDKPDLLILIDYPGFNLRLENALRKSKFTGKLIHLVRSEEHTSELQSHSFISYAVFCLKKKK